MQLFDAQQALAFVQNQALTINARVYETKYPSYDFSRFITVDTSAPEWSGGILTYISNTTGAANWQSGYAKDIPLADVNMDKTQMTFHLGAIGYQYNIEEIGKAQFERIDLPARRAIAARRAAEQFLWSIMWGGTKAAEKNIPGLLTAPGVTGGLFPADGASGSVLWTSKTPAQIVRDINSLLSGIWTSTLEIELADTLIMPSELFQYIASTPYSDSTMVTILQFIQQTNVYTLETGRPLTIAATRAARSAGAGGTGRVLAYANDESVVKFHLPMPFRFLPVYQDGPLNFAVPGIFRTGGVEVLAPGAMRYGDGALAAA